MDFFTSMEVSASGLTAERERMNVASSNLANVSWICTATAGSSCSANFGTGDINTAVSLAVNGKAGDHGEEALGDRVRHLDGGGVAPGGDDVAAADDHATWVATRGEGAGGLAVGLARKPEDRAGPGNLNKTISGISA